MSRIYTDQPSSGKPLALAVTGFVSTTPTTLAEAPDFSIPSTGNVGIVEEPFPATTIGTYSQTGTVVVVTLANNNLQIGQSVSLSYPVGTGGSRAGTSETVLVTSATSAAFTVTSATTVTTSGSVTVSARADRELRPGEVYLESPLAVSNNTNTSCYVEVQIATQLASSATGTYSQTGTTVVVTLSGHTLQAGQSAYLAYTSGGRLGTPEILVVTSATSPTFTGTSATSLTASGNVTVYTGSTVVVAPQVTVPAYSCIQLPVQGLRLLKTNFNAPSGGRLQVKAQFADTLKVYGSAVELEAGTHQPDTDV